MNRRSFFSFLASVPVGIAGIAAAKSDTAAVLTTETAPPLPHIFWVASDGAAYGNSRHPNLQKLYGGEEWWETMMSEHAKYFGWGKRLA